MAIRYYCFSPNFKLSFKLFFSPFRFILNMQLQKLLFIFSFTICLGASAQKNDSDEYIKWSTAKKLTWNDYKGTPQTNADAAASTATYLSMEYSVKDNKLSFIVSGAFNKNKSWVLVKNDHILSHEQGHFDIAEVFARKLYKTLSEYKFNKRTYQKDMAKIYNTINKEKEAAQNKYDKETDYSRNKTAQAEWLIKIKNMLKEVEAFANY
jgi:Bacterial protein of unknown function (DUF922)